MNHKVYYLILSIFLMLFFAACQPVSPDYEAQYRPLIDKFLEAYSTGNVEVVEEIYAPNAVRHSNKDWVGTEAIKKGILGTRSEWPDLKIDLIEAVYAPDKVAFRWRAKALDSRTQKPLEVEGVSIFTIAEGKVVEDWRLSDFLSGYQRLGYTLTPPADSVSAQVEEGK